MKDAVASFVAPLVLGLFVCAQCASAGLFGWSKSRPYAQETEGLTVYLTALLKDNDENFPEAQKLYQEALRYAPREMSVYLNMALALFKQQQYRAARGVLAHAAALSREDPRPRFLLAFSYLLENRLSAAQHLLEYNRRIDPEHFPTLSMLGDLYLLRRDEEKAESIYKGIIQLGGATPRVYYNLGLIHLNQRRLDQAREDFQQVLKTEPQSVRSLMALASVYNLKGNVQEAIRRYEEILLLVPLNRFICSELVSLYEQAGDYQKAKDFQARLIDMGETGMGDYFKLGILCLKAKATKEAIDIFSLIRNQSGESYETNLFLGLAYDEAGSKEQALYFYERALSFSPKDDLLFFHIGAIYESKKDFIAAERFLQMAIQLNPRNAMALNYLGYMYAERKVRLKEAEQLIQRALREEPDSGAYLDSLGWVYYQMKKHRQALQYLQQAAEQLPDDTEVLEHLALCYEALGKKQEAKHTWEHILQVNPNHEAAQKHLRAKKNTWL